MAASNHISLLAALSQNTILSTCADAHRFYEKFTQNIITIDYANNKVLTNRKSNDIPAVIMDRQTYRSMNYRLLPNRKTIILTRTRRYCKRYDGNDPTTIHYTQSLMDAIDMASQFTKNIYIIAGKRLFDECVDRGLCNQILMLNRKSSDTDSIKSNMYELTATIALSSKVTLSIYHWSLETIISIIHSRKKEHS